jgi:hypothetical protein
MALDFRSSCRCKTEVLLSLRRRLLDPAFHMYMNLGLVRSIWENSLLTLVLCGGGVEMTTGCVCA